MNARFAVIGAGNGGQAMAAHLTLLGFPVSLYDINSRKIQLLREKGNIVATGQITGTAQISKITSDLREAVTGCDAIFVVTTTDQHVSVAKDLIPFIKDDQAVVLCPGQTGGAIIVRNVFAEAGKSPLIAETQDLIYTCRAPIIGQVLISALKKHMELAAFSKAEFDAVMGKIGVAYPQMQQAKSILHTGFNNMGAVLHPTPMLMNAGRIECKEHFLYYWEGITPSVAMCLEQIDAERLAVAHAYGVDALSLREWIRGAYGIEADSLYEVFQKNPSYGKVQASTTLDDRYLTEDVPCGLVPLAELGRLAGVCMPLTESVIELACSLLHRDFRAEGRTLKALGLENCTVSEIKKRYL